LPRSHYRRRRRRRRRRLLWFGSLSWLAMLFGKFKHQLWCHLLFTYMLHIHSDQFMAENPPKKTCNTNKMQHVQPEIATTHSSPFFSCLLSTNPYKSLKKAL
jgi:hypothetical protein